MENQYRAACRGCRFAACLLLGALLIPGAPPVLAARQAGGKQLPIMPGMIARVEIRTGEKTILDFLLKPIFKAQEAFRER